LCYGRLRTLTAHHQGIEPCLTQVNSLAYSLEMLVVKTLS